MGDKAGGQFTIPREIIKATCNNFYDMSSDTIKEGPFVVVEVEVYSQTI